MNKLTVSAIIEARMNSSRLKGKVIKKIFGKEILKILISRLNYSKEIDNIIVATSKKKTNKKLINFLKKNKYNYFFGSEDNVLKRIYNTAKKSGSNIVVRLTGDNPLVDPHTIDYMVKYFKKNYKKYDYITNNNFGDLKKRQIAFGLDVSLFKFKSFEKVYKLAKKKDDLEHPTLFFYRDGKKLFKIKNLKLRNNMIIDKKFRLTLDTKEDFLLLKKVIMHFDKLKKKFISINDLKLFMKKNSKLININKNVKQKLVNLH